MTAAIKLVKGYKIVLNFRSKCHHDKGKRLKAARKRLRKAPYLCVRGAKRRGNTNMSSLDRE